ncbi:MAG: phage holin family protein, partial [Opitutaceae bacterium]
AHTDPSLGMNSFLALLVRLCILALGVTLATKIVPGIRCDGAGTLLAVVILLTVFNAVLKPLLVIFTLPFILVTMGLGIVFINALLFLFAGRLVGGFHVSGFGAAFFGSLVVSITNLVISGLMRRTRPPSPPRPPRGGGDVIDI